MKLDFNPNAKPDLKAWATYIPTRSTKPKFATHRTVGHAKSALSHYVGIIYEFVDGEWMEIFRRDVPDEMVCIGCKVPHSSRPVKNHRGYWGLERVPGGRYLHGRWKRGEDFTYYFYCGHCGF